MLIRVAIDQSLEGCHQRHEHRDALTAAQLFQPVKQTPGIDHIDPGALKVLNRRARKISRKIKGEWLAELPKPVLHFFLEDGERPAISNRMLHVDLQHEVVWGQT